MKRKHIAASTIAILEAGYYHAPSGYRVDLSDSLFRCVKHTHCYEPESLNQLHITVLSKPSEQWNTIVAVSNETTLACCERLVVEGERDELCVLCFASARNPGGGFLGGAHAQEESLARSSGLYKSLLKCSEFYEYHRIHRSCLYSDRMIYSPSCPVFRRDDGELLEQYYCVDFITSPAPNAGAVQRNDPGVASEIETVLEERARKILSLAAQSGRKVLVLGAWGCGVFRNDPAMVASTFERLLAPVGPYFGRFRKIVFAVRDDTRARNTIETFRRVFAGYTLEKDGFAGN